MEVWMRASVLCVLSLVCACLGGCQRHQSSDLKTKTKTKSTKQTFLWKATHEQYRGSELYIYGYIHPHLLPTGHLDQAIRKAFHSTKRILVEADYQNPRNRQYRETYIQRYGLLPPGSQMHQRLGRKTLRAYLKVCQDMGVSPSFMSRYRPWLAGLALNAFGFELLGYTRSAPLAPSLVEMARQSQRQKLSPILSVKQDLLTYAELSGKGQEAILLFYTLQMLQWRQATKLKKLQEAYKKGDLWGVERAMFGAIDKYPTQATHIRKLTSDRNIKLTQALKSLIASKDTRYFAIVDIIQLPGQMGLLSLLKNEGFVLKRVARVGQSDASPQPKRPPGQSHARP